MKKFQYILGAAIILSAASCSIENINETPVSGIQTIKMEFSAETPAPNTKTSIDPSADNAVYWTKDDAISVFPIGGGNYKFVLEGDGGSSSGTFAGEATKADTYYALYPYNASASLSGTTITSTLPSTQYSTADGTFDTMLSPVAGISSDGSNNFELQHIAGLLELNFTNLDGTVKEIQMKAAESMAGDYTVSLTDGTFSASAVQSDEAVGVHLVAKDGGPLAEGPYYLVLLPGTYTDVQLFITLNDGASYMVGTLDTFEVKAGELRPQTVDASKATANNDGLYGLFMAGADIYIGGKAYNKEQFTAEDAILHYTSGEVAISSSHNNKITFIENSVTITNLSTDTPTNVVIVGCDPNNKPTLPISGSKYLRASNGQESRMILKNIKIEPADNFSSYMFTVNTNYADAGAFGEFTLDNCNITMTNSAIYQIGGPRYLDKFVMANCTVKIPSATSNTNRYILQTQGQVNTFSEITFRNNIFYCEDAYTLGFKLLAGAGNDENTYTTVGKMTVENNTFVNVLPTNTAMILTSVMDELTFSKNLLYVDKDVTGNNTMRILHSFITYPEIANCTDNIVYNTTTIPCSMIYSNSYHPTTGMAEDPAPVSETPFSDLSTFTQKPEYASYGAQR